MDVGHTILDGNADAVEFCPHESFQNVLAGSTYVLQEGDCPSRSGSITLFDVDADSGRLEMIQKVETAGIFDIKWSRAHMHGPAWPLLAQADADGCVRIYSLQGTDSDDSGMLGQIGEP
ncbi:Transducin/WD40 repeat-like superfamily protein [Striga hermonthica]|uniref:Transducin/WD40 repeat-like superfamily protein n=1 Tax=Striga hermonthica TaxID=68872 RepID=A0A9N7MTL1_STRHE|nr:Transducin/WD40 repeat-like superfamily protein [Striga hermonthica]